MIKYSVIVPCFNEEKAIKIVVANLSLFLEKKMPNNYEIIVIDDGSTDKTATILKKLDIKNYNFLQNPYNKGYGSSLKLGAKYSNGEYLIFYDGDDQHTPKNLEKLLKYSKNYEMIIGSRNKYNGPLWRQPGKKIINLIANYLVNFKIADLNSGLRIVKKKYFNKFLHLYPDSFSLSTTITLAFLKQGLNVKYVPIDVKIRQGKSSVKIIDGFKAINLIFRIIMLFSPLKIFLPTSIIIFFAMLISLSVDFFIYNFNLSESTLILFINAILFFFIGLIADQLASIRREMKL
ncbi:glycosyltransferase family 2 protein [Candidatus Parcubacteria bacterium]|nr:glycosyltransferase family 2 protein [Candidatus Parcubacteria bacterium]